MEADVRCIPPEGTLLALSQQMASDRTEFLVIVEEGQNLAGEGVAVPIGIVTAWDLAQVEALGLDLGQVSIRQAMNTPTFTVKGDATLWDAHQLMQRHRMQQVVVTGEGQGVRGVVTQAQVLQYLNPHDLLWHLHSLEQRVQELEAGLAPQNNRATSPDAPMTLPLQPPPPQQSQNFAHPCAQQARADRWQLALEASNLGIWDWDFETHHVFRSRRWKELHGYDPDAEVWDGDAWRNSIHPEDRDRVLTAFQHHIDQKTPYFQEEYRICRANGTYIWILDRGQGHWDEAGKIIRMVGSEMDVTRRKRVELALREREALYRAVMDGASDAILLADMQGNLIQGNRKAETLLGCSPTEMTQLRIHDIYPQDDSRPAPITFADVTPEGQGQLLNGQLQRRDGHPVAVDVTCSVITVGQQQLQMGIFRDISDRQRIEEQLRKSEAQYRAIVEDQTELICRFLPNGQFTFANGAYCRYFGLDPDQYHQCNLWDYVVGENVSMVRQQVQKLTPARPTITYEERDTLSNNTFRWQIWTDRAIFDDQGQIVEYQSVGHDITERKLTELALQASEEKLQLFIEYAPAAVAMLDQQMRYLAVSNRWRQDYGLGDRPLLGQCHYDVFPNLPHDWREIHQCCLAGAVESREADLYQHDDGRVDWLRWEARPWRRRNGTIGGIVMMTELVTEQRQAQEQLKNLSDRLALAIQAGAIGIWEWDIREDLLLWDDRMYELYGIPRSQFLGAYQAWIQGLHPDDRVQARAEVNQALQDQAEFSHEFRVVWPDGQVRYLKANALIQRDAAGQAERMVGINLDMTERKLAEQQLRQTNERLERANQELEQATRLKDEFLANMSHELRTPLNAILGMAEGLQEHIFGSVNDQQMQALAMIERSGTHLLELISEILDLSKIEAGKLELELGMVSIRSLCDTSVTFVRQAAYQKQIQITTHITNALDLFQGDDRRLRQVLINLLNNAVKFTPEGGHVHLEASLETAPLHAASSSLTFAVRDTGIGIAAEDMHKLFQPFMQIDSSLNRHHSGTGLGLSLVRRIVELHGGTVTVESQVGQGSCFTVCLPYRDADDAMGGIAMELETTGGSAAPSTSVLEPDSQDSDSSNQGNLSPAIAHSPPPTVPGEAPSPLILVADDNQANIDSVYDYLLYRGYQVLIARNGQEAIDTAKAQHPALILMDIQMPGISGLEAIQRLRAEGYADLPIIALTALAMPGDRDRCLAAGANDYLPKPVRLKQLAEKIDQLLQAQRS